MLEGWKITAEWMNSILKMEQIKELFIYYVRKISKKTSIAYPLMRTRMYAYQGVRG